jgi:hypothetical protein
MTLPSAVLYQMVKKSGFFFTDTHMLCIVPNADRDFKECLIPVTLKARGLNFKQVIPVHSSFI